MLHKFSLYISLSILLILSANLNAQNKNALIGSEPLLLEKALNYAFDHSPSLNVQKLKQEQAELKLSQTKLDRLPNIHGSADLRHNLIVPYTPIPASIVNPNASADEIMYMKFSTPWTSSAGVNLSFDIFNPETAGLVSEQRQQLKISEYDKQLSENDLKADVSQAYAECVIAQSQLQSLVADTAYYRNMYDDAQNLYAREKITLVEKNNAQSALNASISRYLQAYHILRDAKTNLLLLMGADVSETTLDFLQLAEDIPGLYEKIAPKTEEPDDWESFGLSDLRAQEMISLAANRTKFTSWKFAPTLSLTGFYGAGYYDRTFNIGNTDRWFGNSYLALSLKVPISRLLSTSKELSQMRVQEQIERENLRDLRNHRNRERMNETSRLETFRKEYTLKAQNLTLARQNLNAAQAQFAKGYILQSDLAAEQMKASSAFQEYLQAAYNVFTSYVTIEKLKKE